MICSLMKGHSVLYTLNDGCLHIFGVFEYKIEYPFDNYRLLSLPVRYIYTEPV